ncbi:MAG: hypothetical protein H0S79_14960 [Anaerolineaceae bacterium]|nr:hypothetical protein [Anaerolineaceae bacterium]
MKWYPKLFIIVIFFFLVGCNAKPELENKILSSHAVVIPEVGPIIVSGWADIRTYGSEAINSYDLGENEYQPLARLDLLVKPVWSSDGKTIFGTNRSHNLTFIEMASGDQKVCGTDYSSIGQAVPMDDPDNPYGVLVSTNGAIYAYDLDRCEEIAVVVDYWDEIAWNMLNVFSYDAPSHTLYYGVTHNYLSDREFQIVALDLDSGITTVVGEGVGPSISNAGDQIAYFNPNGQLWMMNSDGTDAHLLVDTPFFDNERTFPFNRLPIIQWAPEDDHLIYHRLQPDETYTTDVYILDLQTGIETLFLKREDYPDWRP